MNLVIKIFVLYFQKQWQDAIMSDDRLSLTLEEIVHIRSVLTKAELEVLPVEGRVKEDVEKRRVSYYCQMSSYLIPELFNLTLQLFYIFSNLYFFVYRYASYV